MRRRRPVAGVAVACPAAVVLAFLLAHGAGRADDQTAPADPLARAPDIRRPDEPFRVQLFGRPLSLGGEVATEAGYEGNFSLGRDGGDDFGFVLQELELELSYPVTDDVSLFVQGLAYYEGLFEPGDHRVEGALELGEAWLLAEDLAGSGVALQLGRARRPPGRARSPARRRLGGRSRTRPGAPRAHAPRQRLGADGGGAWETEWPGKPSLTVGYAFGSGDSEPGDGRSRAFSQTGLGNNDAAFGGVEYFNYYGELLEPELSNLNVWTVALAFEFWRRSSLVLVHHSYLQAHAAPILRDADLLVDPTGRRRAIGHAWDVVLGLQEWDRVEIDLIGSLFRAGPAYGERAGRLASSIELAVTVNF